MVLGSPWGEWRCAGPPRAGVPTQLLRSKEGLLHIDVAQEPELGLHHPKPVISLERLSCLGEEQWVSGREVAIGGRSWSGSISCPIATMSGIGHELPSNLACSSQNSRIEAIA
jgi:hypothetical protein